jgi:hypothetical protein
MAEARAPDLRDMYSRQGMQVKNGGITLSANGYIKGGQTNYNTGTGFFLGYSGTTYKLSIGNPSGNKLTWDGTTLGITGALSAGSITGSTFDVSTTGYVRGGKTDYATGTGFFLGYSGGAYKFDIGSATSYLRWTGSALSIIGDITGASNLDITGRAVIQGGGYSLGGWTSALHVNYGGASVYGLIAYTATSGGSAGHAVATSGGFGWTASATGGGSAIRGVATTSGAGVIATGLSGATALAITGPTTTDGQITSTLADGTAPLVITSTTLVNNLNAQYLNGSAASAYSTTGHNHNLVYLGITDKAADSNLLDGYDSAVFFRNDGTTTAGDPGAPTHTVNAVINGVTVRVHVSYP